ncbi:prepilin-type N-terminal cleavage/methylation domain-containing protein [Luteolibacter pohnpeiensis]|uniref:Prepilin-type N-terminal cleavage/methylation domain-containing protein n=1 Tax=Luteolibacter pohnpeiensis TaxID=454153 RepID=A0A934SBN0_9BACT|nr:prepilin-type N-terminal cleavage/methylation domain-containing protein [Luteolibacter pohnpeiensis]MBK1882939.1 prepilin-type N-terminal cleavage/methylation domain-containing protein [Luteolibacter pohnpeiensis]
MISPAKTNNSSRNGFTLIEIVMVLAIAAMVTGGAVAMMVYSSSERKLKDASGEIEVLAKRARTIAILHQTPYALEFIPGMVRLKPLVETNSDLSSISSNSNENEEGSNGPVHEDLKIDTDISIFVHGWNSTQWIPMDSRKPQVWRFDPDGLSEPISVRLTIGSGDKMSWQEDTYHPLTASISETQSETR